MYTYIQIHTYTYIYMCLIHILQGGEDAYDALSV